MKRFVICLDGTWNNASREVQKNDSLVYRPTNVLKLARATKSAADGKVDDDNVTQVTYYDAGVGGMNRSPDIRSRILRGADNILGGGWGTGFEINIEEAYTFLANNYEPGDEIFVFGFSRGASQARSLCQLIAWVGGFPPKKDAYYVPTFYSRYLNQRGEGSSENLINEINDRRIQRNDPSRVTIVPAEIKFLGVWDTVLALGWRTKATQGSSEYALAFHASPTPPANIQTIRHALAIDEQRHDFQAEIWEDAPHIEQRWFAGVHSDVGGGLKNDGLANLSLKWMCDEAESNGLAVDQEYLKFYRGNPVGQALKKPFKYKVLDTALWPIRRFHGIRQLTSSEQVIDDAVFKRMNSTSNIPGEKQGLYRPQNLMDYLVLHTHYDSELSPELLNEIQARR